MKTIVRYEHVLHRKQIAEVELDVPEGADTYSYALGFQDGLIAEGSDLVDWVDDGDGWITDAIVRSWSKGEA